MLNYTFSLSKYLLSAINDDDLFYLNFLRNYIQKLAMLDNVQPAVVAVWQDPVRGGVRGGPLLRGEEEGKHEGTPAPRDD